MARGRSIVAVFVMVCLALPAVASEAAADTETTIECGFTSQATTNGFDDETAVASYTLGATWCIQTTYETRTIVENTSSGDELSSSSDDAKVDKAKKSKKGRKGKKAKRARRRAKKRSKAGSSTPRTRTERRVVKACITDFQLDTDPRTFVDGAGLIGVTTTEMPGDACGSRSYHVQGRFAHEYVSTLRFVPRSVVRQTIAGLTVENYPLGRVGYFDIVVRFARDGGATCERCVPSFRFCDVRLASSNASDCVRL